MYWLIQLALFMLTIFLLSIYWRSRGKSSNLPPGPKGLPLIGFIPFIDQKRPYEQLAKLSKKYGSMMSIPIGTTNVIVLNDWKAIKECFVAKSDIFSGRPYLFVYHQMAQFTDIATIHGPRWKEQRRFTLQEMRKLGIGKLEFEDVIMHEVQELIQHVAKISNKAISNSDLWFMSFLNIIWSSVAGSRIDITDTKMAKFIHHLKNISKTSSVLGAINMLPILRYVPGPWKSGFAHFLESNTQILDFLKEEIEKHVNTYEDGVPRDFIDVYLAEIFKREGTNNKEPPYEMKYLVGTVYDLFMAGVETVQRTLEFSILYMLHFPQVQCKIQEELDSVIGKHRFVAYGDRIHLPYTEATLLEIQRLVTVLPFSAPHTPTVTTEVMGYTIPKGIIVIPNLWAVHHDNKYWEDPDTFRPERFLNEDGKVKKPEYLIHFSVGARMCLGKSLAEMEAFLFFSNILHRFSFHSVPGETLPNLDAIMGTVLRAQPCSFMAKQRQLQD